MDKGPVALMFLKRVHEKRETGGSKPNQKKRTIAQLWARFKNAISEDRKIENALKMGDDEPTQKLKKPEAPDRTGLKLSDLVITTKTVTLGAQTEPGKNGAVDSTPGVDSEYVKMLAEELLEAKRRKNNGGN